MRHACLIYYLFIFHMCEMVWSCSVGVMYSSNGIDKNTPNVTPASFCLRDVLGNETTSLIQTQQWMSAGISVIVLSAEDPATNAIAEWTASVSTTTRVVLIWAIESKPINVVSLATPLRFYFRELLFALRAQNALRTVAVINAASFSACTYAPVLAEQCGFSVLTTQLEIADILLCCGVCETTWNPSVFAVYPPNFSENARPFSMSADLENYVAIGLHTLSSMTQLNFTANQPLSVPITIDNNMSPPTFLNGLNENEWQPVVWSQTMVGVVAPTNNMRNNLTTWVIPMPTLQELQFVHKMYDIPEEIAVGWLVGLFTVLCFCLAKFLYTNRTHPSVQGASIRFSLLSLMGIVCVSWGILAWPVENNAITCDLRVPLFSVGYMLFLYPLCASQLRVAIIFGKRLVHKYSFKDINVFIGSIVLAVPHIVATIAWMTRAPLVPQFVTPDSIRPAFGHVQCASISNSATAIMITNLIIYTFGLCLGIFTAFKVRKAFSFFGNSAAIVLSISNIVFVLFLLTFIHVVLDNIETLAVQRLLFSIRSASILSGLTLTTILLFSNQVIKVCTVSVLDMEKALDIESRQSILTPRPRTPQQLILTPPSHATVLSSPTARTVDSSRSIDVNAPHSDGSPPGSDGSPGSTDRTFAWAVSHASLNSNRSPISMRTAPAPSPKLMPLHQSQSQPQSVYLVVPPKQKLPKLVLPRNSS